MAECFAESGAQAAVVGLELADPAEGGVDPLAQGGVGASLVVWRWALRAGSPVLAESFDLGAELGLGVEPGPGDPGRSGDGVEGDGGPGG